jgi:hypothetical protein
MRIAITCLVIGSILSFSPACGKDYSSPLPPAPQFKAPEVKIPGGGAPKVELPQFDDEVVDYGAYQESPDRPIGAWYVSLTQQRGCEIYATGVGRRSLFKPNSHSVKYYVSANGEHELSAHVPRQPHPKGTPVAVIGSQSFQLVAKTAYDYVASPATRQKMVKAMKAHPVMVVTWTEANGTRWEDSYPLNGTSESFAYLAQICPYLTPDCPAGGCPASAAARCSDSQSTLQRFYGCIPR